MWKPATWAYPCVWAQSTRFLRTKAGLECFARFVFAEVRRLEWLRLRNINSFLAIYAFGATMLGLLVAGGYLSASANICHRLLPPRLLVDPEAFYASKYDAQRVPDEVAAIIEKTKGELVLLSAQKAAFLDGPRPMGFMFWNAQTGELLSSGISNEPVRAGDVLRIKQDLGLAAPPNERLARLTDRQISSWLKFMTWSELSGLSTKKLREQSSGKSLADVAPAIDAMGAQSFDIWRRVWIASNVISVLLIENDSDLPASDVHIVLGYAGRSIAIQPLLIWTPSQSPFKYDQKTNSIDISRIASGEQLVLLTCSKSQVLRQDVHISWDRLSEIDISKVTGWMLTLFCGCLCVVIVGMVPGYLHSREKEA